MFHGGTARQWFMMSLLAAGRYDEETLLGIERIGGFAGEVARAELARRARMEAEP